MNCSQAHSPPCKGGVAAPSIKSSRSEKARTGWSLTSHVAGMRFGNRVCERPPRLRPLRMLRGFLLVAQPPLLSQEGNTLVLPIHSHLHRPPLQWMYRGHGGLISEVVHEETNFVGGGPITRYSRDDSEITTRWIGLSSSKTRGTQPAT